MDQAKALEILKTGANVFLTGEPGSGKTYTINKYVEYLRSHGIEPAITASTGIAATHIGGMTIHSWSGIGIRNKLAGQDLRNISTNNYVLKRVSKATTLIIDEISMLPPGTMRMIDSIVREVKKSSLPFGGMQVVVVGDFFQLPPVVKNTAISDDFQEELFTEEPIRFAYDSLTWQQSEFVTCYITEQYRQDDLELLSVLSKIRSNTFDPSAMQSITGRKIDALAAPMLAPKLYSHNLDVDAVNKRMLAQIAGKEKYYNMKTKGHEALIQVMKKGCLSPEKLYLKVGAAVMFTKNNQKEGYVNGTLGVVDSFNDTNGMPIVRIRSGKKIEVAPAEWVVEEDGKVKGRLNQLPLRLAWAITVHKSQGISLDEAVIDLSKVFEYGQGYVALSRVRRFSGIYLLGWNDTTFKVDPEVLKNDTLLRKESIQAEKVYSSISGVELKTMSDDFIIQSGGAINSVDVAVKNKKKLSTNDETLALWKSGKDLSEIAATRKLSHKTILGHMETLVEEGRIKREELVRIIPTEFFSAVPIIHGVFRSLETDKLTPVYRFFDGKYSYDDLKLARMMMKTAKEAK
ncbi:MAG: helix-turn-helix domain-containing protein [Candidatus Berkelbacteria bacterium]